MHRTFRSGTVAMALLAVASASPLSAALLHTWTSPFSPVAEPSTGADENHYVMWQNPNGNAVDKIYLNGVVAPYFSIIGGLYGHAAYFGYWRDCNHDAFIGQALTQQETYPTTLLIDTSICPLGSPYNDGVTVTEFRWICPGAKAPHVDDPAATVTVAGVGHLVCAPNPFGPWWVSPVAQFPPPTGGFYEGIPSPAAFVGGAHKSTALPSGLLGMPLQDLD